MSYTKATIADIEAAKQDATLTGSAAIDLGARAAGDSDHMHAGIERITGVLLAHLRQVADAMHQEARSAADRLGTADWEGSSREMAIAAESSLRSALTTTLHGAEEGAERFRTTMTAEASAFVQAVRGEFHGVLRHIDQAYQELAGAEAAFAANLQQADGSVRFEG